VKTLFITMIALGLLAGAAFVACNGTSATGPNELGGTTDLELTRVGGVFATFLSSGSYNPAFDRLHDSAVITRNDNGIVTTHVEATFDSVFLASLDSILGTSAFPEATKLAVLDLYLKKFDATLDTTDKENMKLTFDLTLRVTSEGIQEYVSSGGDLSRPHTIVKYGWEVGDKNMFTNADGVEVTRTVTHKSTTDDYGIGFLLIKVIKVEQTQEDPVFSKITYIANHKFGLVGVVFSTRSGSEVKLGIFPPTM